MPEMAWDLILWLAVIFPLDIALVASCFYQILMLLDLESDYVNPYEASSNINYYVVPEFIVQGVLCAFFLLTAHWIMFLTMVPLTYYHLRMYLKRQHLLDVTEIFGSLKAEKKYRFIKLGVYLVLLALTIVRLTLYFINHIGLEDTDFLW